MSNGMLIMLAAVLGEIVLLALVLLTVAYLGNRAQRRRDLKAVLTLIARIKNGKAEREKRIVRFLEQGMGMSGEGLEQAKVSTLRAELGLLQRIAGVYRLRDSSALARIDDDLFLAIDSYHALTGDVMVAAAGDPAPVDDNELEQLRNENQRLSEELTITMETMSRMLNEYSTVFAGGEDDTAAAAAAVAAVESDADDEDVVIASSGEVADDQTAAATDEPIAATLAEGDMAFDEDDEIAAILREAQSQGMSARGDEDPVDAGMPDDQETRADEVEVTVEQSPRPQTDAASAAEAGRIEDLDELFDAAGEDNADVIVENADPVTEVASDDEAPLTSQGRA